MAAGVPKPDAPSIKGERPADNHQLGQPDSNGANGSRTAPAPPPAATPAPNALSRMANAVTS